ncbi:MAG: MFS transporter [Candidatus Odinarchaeota archaeon]
MELNNLSKIKRKNLTALAITKLIHGFGTGMFIVVYQLLLLELTNSIVLTGLIVSIGLIMQFIPMPLIGKMSDKFKRKYTLISSIPIYILGLLLLIYATPTSLYLAIFGIMLYYLGFIINNLNAQFLVTENANKSKGLIFGFMFFSYFGGTIAGTSFIILGPALNSRFYLFLFILLLLIEEIFFVFFLSGQTHHIQNPKLNGNNLHREKENMWKKILKTKTLRSVLIFFTLDIFVYSISLSIYSGGLYNYYKLTPENVAFIILWSNIGNAIFQIPAGRITDKIGNRKTLILSQLFGFGFFFMNILSIILWINFIKHTLILTLSIGYLLLSLSVCTFIPAEQIILTNLGENQKAESYGIVSFFRGIGLIPTGILAGLIVENIHYIAPFIFSTIGLVFELLFLIKYFHD